MRKFNFIFILLFFLSFLQVGFSIQYYNAEEIFHIGKINIVESWDGKYYVDVNVENYVGTYLDFDLEIIYVDKNLVSGYGEFECKAFFCNTQVEVKDIFIDDYKVVLTTKYKGKFYRDKKNFDLDLKDFNDEDKDIVDNFSITIEMNSKFFLDENSNLKVSGFVKNRNTDFLDGLIGTNEILKNVNYHFEIFPTSYKDLKQEFDLVCGREVCEFIFDVEPPFVLDKYQVNVYSDFGESFDFFEVIAYDARKNIVTENCYVYGDCDDSSGSGDCKSCNDEEKSLSVSSDKLIESGNVSYDVILDDSYDFSKGALHINGSVFSKINEKVVYNFLIYPESFPEEKYYFSRLCMVENCDFVFGIKSQVILDTYIMNVTSNLGEFLSRNFSVNFQDLDENNIRSKNNFLIFNESYLRNLDSIISNNIKLSKVQRYENFKKVDVSDFAFKERFRSEVFNDEVSLSKITTKKNFEKEFMFSVEEKFLDGSTSSRVVFSPFADSYEPSKGVVSIMKFGTEERRKHIDVVLDSLEIDEFKKKRNGLNGLDYEFMGNLNERSNLNDVGRLEILKEDFIGEKSLVPGIYKKDNFLREDDYYAVGLLSVNTRKPLYSKGEIVEFVAVVLDSGGYPFDRANLSLNVVLPDGSVEFLSTGFRSIVSTNKKGVYKGYLNASQIGEYKVFGQAKVNNVFVNLDTYFNVVPFVEFDILRDVPATIDPWQGPFRNDFRIEVFGFNGYDGLENLDLNNYNLNSSDSISVFYFDLIERVSSDFEIIETDADVVDLRGDEIVLKWLEINITSNPYYVAQTPLVSPYLYELGKASIVYERGVFYENRSWLFAIDPLLVDSSSKTCSDTFGFSCGDWPATSEGDNTFDDCPSSAGGVNDENVIEVVLSSSEGLVGDVVDVTCQFDPYSAGTEEYIYYYNGATWTQIYSGNPANGDVHTIERSVTLTGNPGIHWFRCIVDWDGENDECANQGNYYDNDDVSIKVINPFLTLIQPANISYAMSAVETQISTSVNANISYRIDSKPFVDACYDCTDFNQFDFYTIGQHSLEVVAVDSITGEENRWIEFFTILTSELNPPVDTSLRTCSDTFGFNCGDWPSTSEGDNTFDDCPSGVGGVGDENVIEVIINQSSAYTLTSVDITCLFDPYSAGSEEYIYYYNSTGWRQLYSGNAPNGNVHNVSVSVLLDNVSGTHWFRCIIDWDGEDDECANIGSYYDNDDASITVMNFIANPPFLIDIVSPENVTYNDPNIPIEFISSLNTTMEYSIDSQTFITACTNCDSFSTTRFFRDGVHDLVLRAYDPKDNSTLLKNVSFSLVSPVQPPIDTSLRTCSDTFGFNCGDWPSGSEGDNTFDDCPSSIGGAGDENVIEVIVNTTTAKVGSNVEVTCVFDPYSDGTEEYIYYYNSTGWRQLYSGNAPNGNVHNVSVSVVLDNTSGVSTHWFRCIVDWDGENDECANQGNYYDNDDVSITVVRPVPFEVEILSPVNAVYSNASIFFDVFTTKSSNISYSLDSGIFVDACSNCMDFSLDLFVSSGNHFLEVIGVDVETGSSVSKNVSFSYALAENVKYETFDGVTTNFSSVSDLSNVCGMSLEKSLFGRIDFNECIDANNADLDAFVTILRGEIGLNSQVLPNYNKSANITFYDVNITGDIIVLNDDDSVCYDCSVFFNDGRDVGIGVAHFSNYRVVGNTSFEIFDDSDFGKIYPFNDVKFYANYSFEGGGALDDATCFISLKYPSSWSAWFEMNYDLVSGFYEYNSSFSTPGNYEFNVSCNHSVYPSIYLDDNFLISYNNSGNSLNFTEPTTLVPRDVVDGEAVVVSFKVYDSLGNEITSNVDVMGAKVGGVDVNVSRTNLSFVSSFSVASQMGVPQGLTVYGDELWITSNDGDRVHHYLRDGTFIESFALNSQTTDPRGITTIDGSEFWVVDNNGPNPDDVILHYDSNFNYLDSFSVVAQSSVPYGLSYDGTYFYVGQDANPDSVLVYDAAGVYQRAIIVSAYTNSVRGVTVYGDDLWVVDNNGPNPDDVLLHFKTDGSYVDYFDLSVQSGLPTGVETINGHQFYVADDTNNRVLFYESQSSVYVGDHFEVTLTMPADSGFEDLVDLELSVFAHEDFEFEVSQIEVGALRFPERTPPAPVTGLGVIGVWSNWILWNWTSPADLDFSHVEIYQNGIWIANVSSPIHSYNMTGLDSGTEYNISIRSVDFNGNINMDWVNASALTFSVPVVLDVTPLNDSLFNIGDNVTISANVSDLSGIDLVQAYVFWGLGFEYVNLTDLNLDGIYEGVFNSTSNYGFYNVSIIARGNSGVVNDSQGTFFEIVSNTPFLDTFVNSGSPNTRYDTNNRLMTDSVGAILRTLIRFDVASLIPPGVRVDSSNMRLFLANEGGADLFHSVFRVDSYWNETVTWNTQPTHALVGEDSTLIQGTGVWYSWNLTSLTQNWYDGSYENYGVMVYESPEAINGIKRYYSANSGINVPELVISYTDITAPQVLSVLPNSGSVYSKNDVVTISADVVDNIGVSSVYANVSSSSGWWMVELVLDSGFTYIGNFTNTSIFGIYNVEIIASDATGLVNSSVGTFFEVESGVVSHHIELVSNVLRYGDDEFSVDLKLRNLDSVEVFLGRSLYVYAYLPFGMDSSGFGYSLSSRYVTVMNSTNVLGGEVLQWRISPTSALGVLDWNSGVWSQDNSWSVGFNVSGVGEYEFGDLEFGVR